MSSTEFNRKFVITQLDDALKKCERKARRLELEPTGSDMRELLVLAWLAIVVVGGAATYRGILTVPADQLCIGCG